MMRRLLANIAVSLVSTCICIVAVIVLLEAVLRLTSKPSVSPGYVRTSLTRRYELKPGFRGTTYGAKFSVNSMGLRDIERQPDPAAYRIAIVGDSVTFGIGVDLDQTFSKIVERKLNGEAHGKTAYQVFNLGVPSYNTVQEFVYINEIYDRLKPDMIILEFSAQNDTKKVQIGARGQIRVVTLWKDLLRNMYSYDYLANKFYTFLYNRQASRFHDGYDQRTYYDSMAYRDDYEGWIETKRVFKELKEFCDKRKVSLVVAISANAFKIAPTPEEDLLYPIVSKIKVALADAGIQNVIVLDDAYRAFSGREWLFMVTPTDGHPSAVSHRIIARCLSDYLQKRSLIPG